VDAIEAAVSKPFAEGFAYEQELFRHCLASQEARALLYVFFGERTVAKIPNLGTDVIPHKIKRAAVVGAGFMGTGIAMTLANAGIAVLLTDASEQVLGNARENVGSYYRRAAERGRITPLEAEKRIGLITIRAGLDGLEFADLVIEAVFENLQVKQSAFHQIARVASKGCVLATNTSTLNVDEIAAVTGRPEMVVGLHFFSPAHVMKLLEVVRGKHTSDDVIVSAMALGKELGKVAVPARNGFGFIGNRMVLPYLAEAHACLEDGASVEQINQALYDFGMPMGPLAMEDMVGLDVSFYMRQEGLRRGYGAPSRLADALYYAGHYGQKTGAGWSLYDSARKPLPNPEILRLVGEGVKRNFSDHEIVDRCIGALVAEGHKVLDEGIAQRAVDIDMVYVHGYGFPAWRGGPMFFSANSIK
jgi:3-hydroxyacyl-CoA dehydrogenase